nr:hypothetical protein Hi04_10k_c2835_00029 [uncultured bacterium]
MRESLFDLQHQVVTRRQLVDNHISDDRIRAQVDGGRWRQLTPTLFVQHNGPLTLEQQWWAATLAVGPLAGRSALQSWGVTGWDSAGVEVLVRRGGGPPLAAGAPGGGVGGGGGGGGGTHHLRAGPRGGGGGGRRRAGGLGQGGRTTRLCPRACR